MSGITSSEEEKYVNGSRLSSSLLDLEPFKVVESEAKSMNDGNLRPKEQSNNNNNRYKDRRTHSSPGLDDNLVEQSKFLDSSKMPLLATNANEQTRNGTSVSCENIFDASSLKVKTTSDKETGHSPNRSVEYDPVMQGNTLPKTMTRTPSQERLLINDSPNHVPSEQKKTKPRKPNRESLRRSRPDIRASQPSLPNASRSSASPNGSPEHNPLVAGGQTIPAGHDYEELPTDIRILQQRKVSHPQTEPPLHKVPSQDIGFTPIAFQSQVSPAVPERTKNPRQRLNPLYAGMHMNPYEQQAADGASTQKRTPTRCFRCLVAGVIIAVIFSILSVAAVSLMILGYLEPLKDFAGKGSHDDSSILISKLQSELSAIRNATNQTNARIDEKLKDTKFELINAVKDLNISALKGPQMTDVANCVHKTFGIGSSSSQDEITSGEYFAEKGFVTTGVTCSASTGYVAYLRTREEDTEYLDENDDLLPMARVIYRCVCHKSPSLVLPSLRDRVECSINYWQCPVV